MCTDISSHAQILKHARVHPCSSISGHCAQDQDSARAPWPAAIHTNPQISKSAAPQRASLISTAPTRCQLPPDKAHLADKLRVQLRVEEGAVAPHVCNPQIEGLQSLQSPNFADAALEQPLTHSLNRSPVPCSKAASRQKVFSRGILEPTLILVHPMMPRRGGPSWQ
jgi:hypothetical protein